MKTKLLLLTLGILLISLISAINIYSGDSINLTLDKQFAYYSIVGNSSEVLLNINQIGNNVTITFDKYMKDDSFEIVFFDIEKEVITVYQSSGGGHSRTITKYVNNTEYIDVPVIEYVPNETIKLVENKTVEYKEIKKPTKLDWIMSGVFILFVICLIIYLIKKTKSREDIELEGGLENNGK